MVGGEHYLQISAPQLLWFGFDSALKIFPQTMSHSVNESINDGGDCRTAPATPGLLIMKDLIRVFCTFLRRVGAPPTRMCKIGLVDETLYYYTLLYWGEGGGQYNCRTT